jgi:pilus assembly protein CpaE
MQDYTTTGQGGSQDHIAPLPRVAIQAFCETMEVKQVFQTMMSDRRMIKTMLKVQDGGIDACLEAYRGASTPNVIIIEFSGDQRHLLTRLDQLAQFCDAGTRVVVIGRTNDVLFYRELMRRGVSEYLMAPINVMDMVSALAGLFAGEEGQAVGRVVTFVGSKGGVGASVIAHNVAFATATDFELATTIVDLDVAFGTAGLDFNQDPPQGIAEAVFSPERLDVNFVDRLLSKCTDKLNLLAAPATLDRSCDFRETDFDAIMDILRASTPAIICDMPHQWSSWNRRLLTTSDDIIVVSSPDLANLRNTKSLLDSLRSARPNDVKPGVVLNMVGVPKRQEIGVAEFAKALDCEILGEIPFDAALFGTAANNGQMLVEVQPKAKAVEVVRDIARRITGRSVTRVARKSMLDPILSRLRIKAA